MAEARYQLYKLFPRLQLASFSGFSLSSETSLAEIAMSTSRHARGKMNPNVCASQ